MTGKKQSKEKVPPPLKDQSKQSGSEAADKLNTDHTAISHDPAAVGAGPGNQVQENETQPAYQSYSPDELKPGAQPDGTASVGPNGSRNEDIEQIGESRAASGIE